MEELLLLSGTECEVRQTKMHTAEPLVLEPSPFKVEIVFKRLKGYKTPHTGQILAELIHAGGNTLCSEIHKLINYILNKKELPQHWQSSQSSSVSTALGYRLDDWGSTIWFPAGAGNFSLHHCV
jgi:hypothetical protein